MDISHLAYKKEVKVEEGEEKVMYRVLCAMYLIKFFTCVLLGQFGILPECPRT